MPPIRCSIFLLIATFASCSREHPPAVAPTGQPGQVAIEDPVELRGRVVDGANVPYARSALFVEFRVNWKEDGARPSLPYRSTNLATDGEGRFTFRIPRWSGDGCTRTLAVGPSRDALDSFLDPRPRVDVDLPARIEGTDFDVGDVRMIPLGTGRPYESLSDDELESALPRAQISSVSEPRHELESLLTEMITRGGPRFEAFLQTQLSALRENPADSVSKRREFFVLTALRRVQHRPDPLQVRIVDEVLRSEFPQIPVVQVQLVNADEPGTTLAVVENCRSWCFYWYVEVRTPAGERVLVRAEPFMGSTGYDSRRMLAPGESVTEQVPLAEKVAFTSAGVYEARFHFQEQEYISQVLHLENRIVSSSPWVRLEILPRTVRSTRAELQRARDAIAAVTDSTPVRVKSGSYDPSRPFKGEARTSEEILWTQGWKSLQPLLEALDQKPITTHERAWILAELFNLTDVNDPRVQRGVLDEWRWVDVNFDENRDVWVLTDNQPGWPSRLDEARQLEFAQRWKRTAQSFRFETVDETQPK